MANRNILSILIANFKIFGYQFINSILIAAFLISYPSLFTWNSRLAQQRNIIYHNLYLTLIPSYNTKNSKKQSNHMQYSQLCSQASISKFSPDSTYFIHFDNTKLFIKQSSVELKTINIITSPATITDAQISTNGKYVAVFVNKKSLVLVYRVSDGELVAKIEDTQGGVVGVFWVVGALQLMVFSQYMYKVSIYNLADQKMSYIKAPKLSTSKGFSFSSNGTFLALLQKHECKDYLSIYYTRDWKMVNTYPLDLFDAIEVKWSPNDAYITVWDNCINYRLVTFGHLSGLVFRYEPYNFALGIKSVRYSCNSLFLAIGSYDEKIRLINALTWKEIGELDCSNPVINCQKTSVHKEQQSTRSNTNRMRMIEQKFYKIPTMKIAHNTEKGTPNQGIGLLQFSSDDQYVACRNDNMPYTVWIWDVSTLQPVAIISCTNQIKGIKWTKKENYLCIYNGTDRVVFWRGNGTIAECVFSFQHKKIAIQKIKWSNDGMKALISDKNEVVYAQMIPEALEKPSLF